MKVKTTSPGEKPAKDINRQLSEEEKQIAYKPIKGHSVSPPVRERKVWNDKKLGHVSHGWSEGLTCKNMWRKCTPDGRTAGAKGLWWTQAWYMWTARRWLWAGWHGWGRVPEDGEGHQRVGPLVQTSWASGFDSEWHGKQSQTFLFLHQIHITSVIEKTWIKFKRK